MLSSLPLVVGEQSRQQRLKIRGGGDTDRRMRLCMGNRRELRDQKDNRKQYEAAPGSPRLVPHPKHGAASPRLT